MTTSNYVQKFDSVPQFWQFLKGLRTDDLIVELIQNDLDANAKHTSISFELDRLVCQGDGEPVEEQGWERLSYVMGAGDQVESKQFRIGVKNHGLNPNPPKDTDGRREGSGRGWVRELQGRWPGVLG